MLDIPKIDRHLCFVCANSYPLFTDDKSNGIGGVETRSVRLAEMMSKYFRKVSFAIRNTAGNVINDHNLNVVRYEPAVISNAPNRGLAKINADIYIVFESHCFTADVVRTCNMISKPVVHWATSFIDYDKACTLDNSESYYYDWIGREGAYCFYFADHLISQTEDQQRMLFQNHGLRSVVIRNPVEITEVPPINSSGISTRPTILWIGRTERVFKRPEVLFQIAIHLPAYRFLMILNNTNNQYFEELVRSKPDNVEIVEYVAPDEIGEVYKKSQILLSTSSNEGFPNIFLQAISHGVPIISLDVDPDGLFTRHECGIFCSGDLNRIPEAVESLLNDKDKRDRIVGWAFKYVRDNHSTEVISNKMVEFFGSVPLNTMFPLWWTEISFDRVFEKFQADHERLMLQHEHLKLKYEMGHNSLLWYWMIGKLKRIRRLI